MNKTKVILLFVCIVLSVTFLVVGLMTQRPTDITPPTIETTKPPTEPPKVLDIPYGTYYYIGGTHTAYSGQTEHMLYYTENFFPNIACYDNVLTLSYSGNMVQMNAWTENNVIVFKDNGEMFRSILPIDVEHDDDWHSLYYPRQEKEWTCTYDKDAKTITVEHNSDFAQFQYFETIEEYVQYITDTYSDGEFFEIYPTPSNLTE